MNTYVGLMLVSVAGLFARGQAAWAQTPVPAPDPHPPAVQDDTSRNQAPAAPAGFRFFLEGNLGRPVVRGGAERVWDAVGGLGAAPGLAAGMGYDARRFGLSVAIDLAGTRPEDREGAGLGLVALLHWRPDLGLPGAWTPRLSAGYVRQGLATDFEAGEFPPDVTVVDVSDSEVAEGGSALTIGDGIRLAAAAERTFLRASISGYVAGSIDLLTFRQVEFRGFGRRLREAGWSAWPRFSLGLQLYL